VRAVVLDADGLPELADLPEPDGPGQLVRVRACGLCGSDVEKLGRAGVGTVLGHEIEGELGDGTRVTVVHRVPCGTCERCCAGHESTCAAFAELQIEPGGFAERLTATRVVAIPDDVDGIWVEPLACILRAAEQIPVGRVLVVGCGAVGLLWIQVLLRRGNEVAVVEPRAERLELARELGASVDAASVSAAVLTAHGGYAEGLTRLEPGGRLVVFSAPSEPVPVPVDLVYRRELTLVGSRSATPAAFDAAVAVLPTLVAPPVTSLPLDRFDEGVELYRRGEALKVAFTP
jgi:threonine dehydrogenase-like Zn-dependent dehydrogenase